MKNLIFTLILVMSLSSFAGVRLVELSESSVPAALVESLDAVTANDKKITARLLSVYRGSAAGMSSIIITLLDSGPSNEDYPNTHSYELTQITEGPKNISLIKLSKNKYALNFNITEVNLNSDGNFIYTKKLVKLVINLDQDGNVTSVEK